jgi:hypothetical protein
VNDRDLTLWEPPKKRPPVGETRRALDRDLAKAEAAGKAFLETAKAAIRRQANDIDRLELMFTQGEVKPWDYNPKTQAHQAYREALKALFGAEDDDADDPFIAAVNALNDAAAARARAAAALDPEGPE